MDNFTHSLAGWALGQTGLKTKSRKGLAALLLGANMPDVDVFFGWIPWAPLATHRGFTHGLLGGIVILPMVVAGLLWLLDQWQCRRETVFRSGLPMNMPWLIALSYFGAITHPLLDLQTTYAIQLFSPFSTAWFHTETLFIIDVVIWSVLAVSIWLSRRRERQNGKWRHPAIFGLGLVCAYVGLNGIISLTARQMLIAHLGGRLEILYAGQEPILFWKRNLVWRQNGMIGQASYDPVRNIGQIFDVQRPVSDEMDDPLVHRAIAATPSLRPFLRWSTMPVAIIQRCKCEASVLFADARFMTPVTGGDVSQRSGPFGQPPVILPLASSGCPE